MAGVLVVSVLIGLITDTVSTYLAELSNGASRVVEKNHTLILGWTHETVMVIEEICIANESEGGGIIVVLADMHKQEMEMDMAMQLGGHVQARKRLRGTKVVLRSGSPMLVPDLAKVSATEARATLILAEPGLARHELGWMVRRCLSRLAEMTRADAAVPDGDGS